MLVIKERNVNGLYKKGMRWLHEFGQLETSRAGKVRVMATPVVSVYERPTERVLFDTRRNANPFFHLYESLWMLAGRNEYNSLNMYVSDFGSRFGEKTGDIHGAYGHRWRNHFGFDQLEAIITRLNISPADRQCVLQMWDATPELTSPEDHAEILLEGGDDLNGAWKDRPCNTHIYFRVRAGVLLDMTILCRSNDVVWGAYGANAVHFSILMEYVAGRLGVEVGTMYQVSNNYHGYIATMDSVWPPTGGDPYHEGEVTTMQIGDHWDEWDTDLVTYMHWHDRLVATGAHGEYPEFTNQWFLTVAMPMAKAYWKYKHAEKVSAVAMAETVMASDWRVAAVEWFKRRGQK